jgi:glycosyltransferase involved in cell wall biosynthesis
MRVLFVGRLVYYKGIDILIRTIAMLPQAELTIVGAGPLRGELISLARELSVDARTRFLGSVSDDELATAYLDHDVLVLPSVSAAEAFGLAMVEAMASGLPVISTSLGTGTDWVNINGVTGLVVPPGDETALQAALIQLEDDDQRIEMGSAARTVARDRFSFDRHLEALLELYSVAAADHA